MDCTHSSGSEELSPPQLYSFQILLLNLGLFAHLLIEFLSDFKKLYGNRQVLGI